MKLFSILIVILIFLPKQIFACYEAELYKIYPVGILNDTIIAIDIHILRNNAFSIFDKKVNGNIINNIREEDSFGSSDVGWIIRSYISKYDKNQNKIGTIPLDSVCFYKKTVIDELGLLYQRGFERIISENNHVELFQPVAISFCDYSCECKNLISDGNKLITQEDIDSFIRILKDRPDYKFAYLLNHEKTLLLKTFSSVRRYKSSLFELIVIHSQIGQMFGDEKIPHITLGNNINSAVYEEPILYHGIGSDVFFVR